MYHGTVSYSVDQLQGLPLPLATNATFPFRWVRLDRPGAIARPGLSAETQRNSSGQVNIDQNRRRAILIYGYKLYNIINKTRCSGATQQGDGSGKRIYKKAAERSVSGQNEDENVGSRVAKPLPSIGILPHKPVEKDLLPEPICGKRKSIIAGNSTKGRRTHRLSCTALGALALASSTASSRRSRQTARIAGAAPAVVAGGSRTLSQSPSSQSTCKGECWVSELGDAIKVAFVLFVQRCADVAERDPLGVLDDGAPWRDLRDDNELFYPRESRRFVLLCERQVAVPGIGIVSARLSCEDGGARES